MDAALGTAQLGSVVAREHLATRLGPEQAKRLAKQIVCETIDGWRL